MSSKKTTYYADDIEKIIGIDPNTSAESWSGRVGFLIGAADKVAIENCPVLPAKVWCALADANNGTFHQYETGLDSVVSGITLNLFDYGNENPWGVDAEHWARTIRKMPFAAQFAVFEVVRRFWTARETVNSAADYADAFRRLGARIEE